AQGPHRIVARPIEIEVVIFIEDDRHGAITRCMLCLPHYLLDSSRIADPIPVQQQKIGRTNDVVNRNGPAAVTGADKQPASVAPEFTGEGDELMDAIRPQNSMIVP